MTDECVILTSCAIRNEINIDGREIDEKKTQNLRVSPKLCRNTFVMPGIEPSASVSIVEHSTPMPLLLP